MHIAVICLTPAKDANGYSRHMHGNEARQALGLAEFLARKHDSTLICSKKSDLARLAPMAGLRCLFTGSPLDSIRIWNWQRRHKAMRIIAVGPESPGLARRLKLLGKTRQMDCLFLLEAPVSMRPALLYHADHVVCGSSHIAEKIRDLPFGPDKHRPDVSIAAPGIDLAGYKKGSQWHRGERLILGMANSLMPESGALLVIRSMAALWQGLADWEVRMFGSGPRYDEIMEEAEKMGVLPRLAILGDQPLNEAAGQCHIWLAPGASVSEPPQTLWAGFGAGIPVICSKSALHEERVFNPKAALMVDSDNPQELAAGILRITQEREQREELAESGFALRPLINLEGMAERVCQTLELA